MKNYIHIDDICSVNDGKICKTTSRTTIHVGGIPRSSVVGVLVALLQSMKINPIEILLWEAEHDSSNDETPKVEVP